MCGSLFKILRITRIGKEPAEPECDTVTLDYV